VNSCAEFSDFLLFKRAQQLFLFVFWNYTVGHGEQHLIFLFNVFAQQANIGARRSRQRLLDAFVIGFDAR
jgi:hypothetical protein